MCSICHLHTSSSLSLGPGTGPVDPHSDRVHSVSWRNWSAWACFASVWERSLGSFTGLQRELTVRLPYPRCRQRRSPRGRIRGGRSLPDNRRNALVGINEGKVDGPGQPGDVQVSITSNDRSHFLDSSLPEIGTLHPGLFKGFGSASRSRPQVGNLSIFKIDHDRATQARDPLQGRTFLAPV